MKNTREILMYVLGAFIVGGFFALLYVLLFTVIPEQNKSILDIVIGALISAFTSIVSYFYGSSVGSRDKSEMLNNKNNNK